MVRAIQPPMRLLGGIPVKELGKELVHQFKKDRILNSAAAQAFYLTLAIFPGLICVLSLLPYLPIADLHQAIMDLVHQVLPGEAAQTLTAVVEGLTEQRGGLLSFSILGTLLVASSGMAAVIKQLNITYHVPVKEERSFLRTRALALLLTILGGALVIVTFALVVLGGTLQSWIASALGWSDLLLTIFAVFRWVVIVVALLLGFAAIYYLAPNVKQKFRWVTPGAVIGVVALILATLGFRLYVDNFGRYGATYGSIGALIVLMLWLYVSGLMLLVGSEVNALYERHVAAGRSRGRIHPHRLSDIEAGAGMAPGRS
jgi:membrane protein